MLCTTHFWSFVFRHASIMTSSMPERPSATTSETFSSTPRLLSEENISFHVVMDFVGLMARASNSLVLRSVTPYAT